LKDLRNESGKSKNKRGFNPFAGMNGFLFNDDVYKRIGGFLLWGLVILLIFWGCSVLFLPGNVLNKTFLVEKIFGNKGTESFGSFGQNWLGENFKFFKWEFETAEVFNTWGNVLVVTAKNFAHHLVVAVVFIFLLNRFRIGRLSLGMLFFFIYTALSGVVVGTDSIPYPAQVNNVLGPVITFLRYGIWIWFAYGLLTVATQQWTWLKSDSLLDPNWEKTGRFWPLNKLTPDEKEVFVFGCLFLLAASFAEARLIVLYGRHFF